MDGKTKKGKNRRNVIVKLEERQEKRSESMLEGTKRQTERQNSP